MLINLTLIFVFALIISYVSCAVAKPVAKKLGYVDVPYKHKAHKTVMPLGGGIALVFSFTLIILVGLSAVHTGIAYKLPYISCLSNFHSGIIVRTQQISGILFCAFLLLVLGIFDDIKDLGPFFKLAMQFAIASLVVIGFNVKLYLFIKVPIISYLISIIWIVTITNAINFMDNTDGLAAGVSLICSFVLLAVSALGGQLLVSAYLACLAGALAGFLFHNFPPAKIFLGDAGSQPIGFLLAIGTILTTYYYEQNPQTQKTSVLMPVIVLAIPIYDFLSVIVLRLYSGVSPFVGDHRHFSHRLISRGLTKRQTVLTIYLASIGTAIGAIILRSVSGILAWLVIFQTLCIVAIIAILEYQPNLYDEYKEIRQSADKNDDKQ